MPKKKRKTIGGYIYHVINRANGKLRIFQKPGDFLAFENILGLGQERFGMRICGYCIMGNHWHLLLWPINDGDLSGFMHWVTVTHTKRYHVVHNTVGTGHIYQGRFKSFPIQGNCHYLRVLRYIEANPVRASLVVSASQWSWSSYQSHCGETSGQKMVSICQSPVVLPERWPLFVHKPISEHHRANILNSIKRSSPLGDKKWQSETANIMELQSTITSYGRPQKQLV